MSPRPLKTLEARSAAQWRTWLARHHRSATNRRRYARLRASGRLRAAGRRLAPTGRGDDAPRRSRTAMPRYIRRALERHPAAGRCFAALAPSYRSMYIAWIDSAKREATKARRLAEAIALLAAGRKLGLK